MKIFKKMKDGGSKSTVTGYFLIEIKSVFSIALLRFDGDSREAFHTHAFNCLSWILSGELVETMRDGRIYNLRRSLMPFLTTRKDFHKVSSITPRTWLLTFRGPWSRNWFEYIPETGEDITLKSGRVVV